MSTKNILITGGAGFIGSHLADTLLSKGHEVFIFDNLDPQVHMNRKIAPKYLNPSAHFILGDVRNRSDLQTVLQQNDIEVIYHLAARVGVAQSMYQIHDFYDTNTSGTANLLDILVNEKNLVKKLVVASSMSTYGEGAYKCADHGIVSPKIRTQVPKSTNQEDWELKCPICNKVVQPIPTPESKKQDCTTIYALTKKDQEDMCMMIGETYGINTTALRFFGTYGSRQALSNPYTGVCAIFSTSLLSGNSPLIYEDGNQTRDLVHVRDICQGLILSMDNPLARNEIFNVGTGQAVSILDVAKILGKYINPSIVPKISYKIRAGDVRHTTADISKIHEKLGYTPTVPFEEGIKEVINWIKKQDTQNVSDHAAQAQEELRKKGLL